MLLMEHGRCRNVSSRWAKSEAVALKIRAGSLSGRIEFNFSKLYYPRCFGEA